MHTVVKMLYVESDIRPCDQKNSARELKSVENSSTGLPSYYFVGISNDGEKKVCFTKLL